MIGKTVQDDTALVVPGWVSNRDIFQVIGPSPQDPTMVRVKHTQASVEVDTPPEAFSNAFSRWARAPEVQGPGHWLVVQEDGPGSQFILYDKPCQRDLSHVGVVTEIDRGRRFAWRAPFGEWSRAYIGTILEIAPMSGGGSRATETMYFDAREDHLPVVAGLMALSGFDQTAMAAFLEARLKGLDRLIQASSQGSLARVAEPGRAARGADQLSDEDLPDGEKGRISGEPAYVSILD